MRQYVLPEAFEFAENPEPRCACILLLDTSSSMTGTPINALNQGLQVFQTDLAQNELAAKRVEVAIITFGNEVRMTQDFITANRFEAPTLNASGTTPMGAAILQGLYRIQDRKAAYSANNIPFYRPWIFMITDGEPTDEWQSAARRIHEEEEGGEVAFFAVGVGERANMGILAQISARQPVKLRGLCFSDMFLWLSKSTQSVSYSRIGEQVALTPPTGWIEV